MGFPRGFNILNFDPDVLLDLSNPDGVTVDVSDNITNILDLSEHGVNYYQTADLNRTWTYAYDSDVKKYIGVGGLKGGLSNSYYQTPADYISTTSDTWFFIFKEDPAGTGFSCLLCQYGNIGVAPPLFLVNTFHDISQSRFVVQDVNSDFLVIAGPIISGWNVVALRRQPGGIKRWYNQTVSETTGAYVATTYLAHGVGDRYNPVLGARTDEAGLGFFNFFGGRFGLMAKFNSALSDGLIKTISDNLAVQWNIGNY